MLNSLKYSKKKRYTPQNKIVSKNSLAISLNPPCLPSAILLKLN